MGTETSSGSDYLKFAKVLTENYFAAVALDNKPEKGERKMADEFLVLLNEHLEGTGSPGNLLFLTTLNQHALSLSPYNFDLTVAQAKLFTRLGMSLSFQDALAEMNLKSV